MNHRSTGQSELRSTLGPASRWQVLSEAVRAFAETTEAIDSLLPVVARYVGMSVNATCVIRLLSEDGRFLNPSALWCPQSEMESLVRRTLAAAPVRVRRGTTAYEAMHAVEPVRLLKVVLADLGVELRPEHESLRREIEPGPLLLLPLRNRDAGYGLVYLIRRPDEPGFSNDELELVRDLGDQAAVALGNALRIRTLQNENAAFKRDVGRGELSVVDPSVQRADAMTSLAFGLAHDYDNLISVIRMCTNLQLEALGANDPLLADLERVRAACEDAAQLTPLLTVLAQRQFLEPELVDPVPCLETMRGGLEQILEPMGTLHFELEKDGVRHCVCVDRPQFVQAISDLMLNARNALVPPGHVRLAVSLREIADDDLLGIPGGAYSVISIEDDGVGMDTETLSRATRPFFSRWDRSRSTGIGLASVVAFAQQSGGTLAVTSRPRGGSTISLFLPVVDQPNAQMQGRHAHDGIETILLAVSDFAYRAELRSLLRRHGYQVLEVHTSEQAVAVARAFDDPVHLIIYEDQSASLADALTMYRPNAARLPVGADPRHLSRGQQALEVLSRVRRALSEPQRA